MPIVSFDGMSFSTWASTFNLLPSKPIKTRIWNVRPFSNAFRRLAHGFLGQKQLNSKR
jgi:hypothetical protein